eukprot:s4725_g1.t1
MILSEPCCGSPALATKSSIFAPILSQAQHVPIPAEPMPSTTLLEVQGERQSPLVVKNTFIDEDASDQQSRKRWATAPDTMYDWDADTSLCDGSPMTDLQSSLSACETPETLTLSSVRMRNASSESETLQEGLSEMELRKTVEGHSETLDQWPQSRDQATSTDEIDEVSSDPPTPRGARPNRRSSMMQTQDYWPEYQQVPTRPKADAVPMATSPAPAVPVAPAAPLNLCQAIANPALAYPAISPVPGIYDMYGGYHYYAPVPGFAPVAASPWPLYQPPLTQAGLLQLQLQMQQQAQAAAAQQAALNAALATPGMRVWDVRLLEAQNSMTAPVMQMEPKQDIGTILAEAETWEAPDVHRKRNGTRRLRLWVHIYLHMRIEGRSLDEHGNPRFFDLVPALIGRCGCHTRRIHEITDAKIRIRGQGSGHWEIEGKYEAPVPLMVAISTDHQDPIRFRMAVEMMLKEIKRTEKDKFELFLRRENIQFAGPRYSMGLVEKNVEEGRRGGPGPPADGSFSTDRSLASSREDVRNTGARQCLEYL